MTARDIALLIVATWVASCASAPDLRQARTATNAVLAPYALREECLNLNAGDRLDFRFDASDPVRFALQVREGVAVVEPLVRERTTGEGAIYPVAESRFYCLTWEAGAAGTLLTYRVVPR